MISINKPHTGWDDPELDLRMDWNSLLSDDPDLRFTHYTDRYFPDAGDYLRYLADYASACGLRIEYRTPIARVARAGDGNGAGNGDGGFTLTDGAGRERHARRVVVATGSRRPSATGTCRSTATISRTSGS
jgi:cation diffusion facilitator CzcD-associated flavoprotein CzcO